MHFPLKLTLKTIYENGIEVVSASNVLAQDFSHGWQSGQRVYRIEAAIGVASDHLYTFSIDGIKYIDFPFKREVNITSPANTTPTRKASVVKDGGGSANKYPVSASSSSSPSDVYKNDRGRFQSPESFDPFESSAEPFDPFEDNKHASSAESFAKITVPPPHKLPTPVANKQRNPSISLKTPSPQTTVRRPEPNLFDEEAPSRPSAAAALFDPFDDAPLPQSNTSADFFPRAISSSFDPFDPTSTHTDNFQSSNNASNDDLFASFNGNTNAAEPKRNDSSNILDLFGPTESNAPVAQTNTFAFGNSDSNIYFASSFDNFDSAPAPAALTSTSDFLFSGASSSTHTDLFGSDTTVTATTNTAQWNASTMPDLMGLSFDVTPSESTKDAAVTIPFEAKPMHAAVEDPWKTSSLVDLDLSGKSKLANAKKPLITATSLSSMLQDGSFTTSKTLQSSILVPKSTGLTPPGPYGTGLVPPAPPSFATAQGFPPSLPGAIHQPAFQPPVYGRGLGSTANIASPPTLGLMGTGSPVQAYGTGLGGGFAPSSHPGPGFGQPVMGGMNRPGPGMGGLNPGYGGTGPQNNFSMGNGMGVGLRPPAPAAHAADPRGIMAGGKGNSINTRANNTATSSSSSTSNGINSTTTTTGAGKDILTFNGLGVLPSPRKVNQPAQTSLDSINWRG